MGYKRRHETAHAPERHAELSVNVLKCQCLIRCHGALVSGLLSASASSGNE